MNEADFPSLKKLSFSVNIQSHLCKLKSNQNKKIRLIFIKSRYKLSAYEFTVSELTVNQEGQHTFGCGEDFHRSQEHFNDGVLKPSELPAL